MESMNTLSCSRSCIQWAIGARGSHFQLGSSQHCRLMVHMSPHIANSPPKICSSERLCRREWGKGRNIQTWRETLIVVAALQLIQIIQSQGPTVSSVLNVCQYRTYTNYAIPHFPGVSFHIVQVEVLNVRFNSMIQVYNTISLPSINVYRAVGSHASQLTLGAPFPRSPPPCDWTSLE